jgi:hypothetical protein
METNLELISWKDLTGYFSHGIMGEFLFFWNLQNNISDMPLVYFAEIKCSLQSRYVKVGSVFIFYPHLKEDIIIKHVTRL